MYVRQGQSRIKSTFVSHFVNEVGDIHIYIGCVYLPSTKRSRNSNSLHLKTTDVH